MVPDNNCLYLVKLLEIGKFASSTRVVCVQCEVQFRAFPNLSDKSKFYCFIYQPIVFASLAKFTDVSLLWILQKSLFSSQFTNKAIAAKVFITLSQKVLKSTVVSTLGITHTVVVVLSYNELVPRVVKVKIIVTSAYWNI